MVLRAAQAAVALCLVVASARSDAVVVQESDTAVASPLPSGVVDSVMAVVESTMTSDLDGMLVAPFVLPERSFATGSRPVSPVLRAMALSRDLRRELSARLAARADTSEGDIESQLREAEEQLQRVQHALDVLRAQQAARASGVPPAAESPPPALEERDRDPDAPPTRYVIHGLPSLDFVRSDPADSMVSGSDEWVPALSVAAPIGGVYHARRVHAVRLEGGERVVLTHAYGDVLVEAGEADRAEVVQRIGFQWNGEDRASVERYLKGIALDVVRQGDSLTIALRRPQVRPEAITGVGVDLTVRLPSGYPLAVRSSYGDVAVHGLSSELSATSDFGDVEVVRTDGPLRLRARNGDVTVRRHTGSVTVDASCGAVTFQDVSGPTNLLARFSDTVARSLEGPCTLHVRGGSMVVSDVDGPLTVVGSRSDLDARGIDGPLHITNELAAVRLIDCRQGGELTLKQGRLEVMESAGNLQVNGQALAVIAHDPEGRLHITNEGGDIVVDARQAEDLRDLRATTSGGSVVLYLPNTPSAEVQAVARHGDVRSDIPLVVSRSQAQDEVRASGRLGTGRARVVLENDGGSVFVCTNTSLGRVRGGTPHTPRRARLREPLEGVAPDVLPALNK
jgi:formylmethanofuran dehydrogenase subunit D